MAMSAAEMAKYVTLELVKSTAVVHRLAGHPKPVAETERFVIWTNV